MTKTRQLFWNVTSSALLFLFVIPAFASFHIPNFSSPTYVEIYKGEKPSSELPYWHGFLLKEKISDRVGSQLTFWTEFLYKQVSKSDALINSTPRGISHFCPRYVELNRERRIVFWTRLISIIAAYESGLDPSNTYNEPTMKGVTSTGLLQLSNLSTMAPEYNCDMIGSRHNRNLKSATNNLKDPLKNLACGVRIMNYWIAQDKTMVGIGYDEKGEPYWKGLARYWGTFRHPMLKDEAQEFWEVVDKRREGWQQASRKRDKLISEAIIKARAKDESWGNKEWRARSYAPHPSILDYLYDKQESRPLTAIVRLANQTAFCF